MRGQQVFGFLLVAVGAYAYHEAASGAGFLGLTNPKWPGLATVALGVLFIIGVFK
jgi:hypothetical protein